MGLLALLVDDNAVFKRDVRALTISQNKQELAMR